MTLKKTTKFILYCFLTLAGIMSLFPFFWMILNTFSTEEHIFAIPPQLVPDLLGTRRMFENYTIIFSEFNWGRYTLNSFLVTTMASVGQIVTCSLSGFVFARMQFRGKNVIFSLLLATMMIPVQATIIPEFLLMMKLEWIDSWLPLIVPSMLVGSFGTFMFKEFYENIPSSFVDAAAIDGAGAFNIYGRIFLPMSGSQITTLFIISFMNNWNDLLRPLLYISSDKWQLVTQALTLFQSQYSARWNLILTGSVLSILPLLVVYIFLQKYLLESSITSGVKG